MWRKKTVGRECFQKNRSRSIAPDVTSHDLRTSNRCLWKRLCRNKTAEKKSSNQGDNAFKQVTHGLRNRLTVLRSPALCSLPDKERGRTGDRCDDNAESDPVSAVLRGTDL